MEQQIDVIKFKMQIVDEEGNKKEKIEGPTFDVCTGEEGFQKLVTKDHYIDPACIYIYRKEFFVENHFQYKKGTYHEDFGLTTIILLKAKTFASVKEYGYFYRQTNESITRNTNYEKEVKKANDLIIHYDTMIKTIKDYEISKKTKDLVKRYYTNSILLKAKNLQEKELKDYKEKIKQRKMYQNIKPYNLKQLIKRMIIYIKMR